jgi:DNA-binding NarL/FixJ family response regulator
MDKLSPIVASEVTHDPVDREWFKDAMPPKSRLLLVDDHAIVREGLVSLFEDEPDMEVVGESDSAHAALQFVRSRNVDVVVLDLRMPGMSAVDAIYALRAACPALKIVILTSFFEDSEVHAVLSAGAAGFLLKDAPRDDILLAIRRVAAGESWIHHSVQNRLLKLLTDGVGKKDVLTQREGQVLQLVGEGLSNKRIEQALGITEGTVKSYLRQLFPKIRATDRLQAALFARGLRRTDGG